ncbi:MAG: hypothetical protein LC664_14190 [Flavobacteriales bacterium]|nr:hypothetical protein [Flavobacteriales bacterium]
MKRITIYLCLSVLLASCAFHEGMISGSAALTNGDFRVLRIAQGSAKTVHVLGIGGLDPQALVYEAKLDMHYNNPLNPGQVFANFTVDFKRSFFPLVGTTIATVTAEVIEFNPADVEKADNYYKQQMEEKERLERLDGKSFLVTGDSVGVHFSGKFHRMKALELVGSNASKIESENGSTFIFNLSDLYLIEPEKGLRKHRFEVGQDVEILENGKRKSGVIEGINPESAVVRRDSELVFVKIKELLLPETD